MNEDRYFTYLSRFNSAAIAVLIVVLVVYLSATFLENKQYEDTHFRSHYDDVKFGHGRDASGDEYAGREFETANGTVTGYFYGELPTPDEGERSSGLTLIHMETGKQVSILENGSDRFVTSFEVVEDAKGNAVAYLARISTEEEYGDQKSNLVVGSFADLNQREVAPSVMFLDTKVLTQDGRLMVLYWPDEETAKLASISLSPLDVKDETQISIPPPIWWTASWVPSKDVKWDNFIGQ